MSVSRLKQTVSEFNEFKTRLKSPKNRFQLSVGLNLEKLNTILSGTNFFKFGLYNGYPDYLVFHHFFINNKIQNIFCNFSRNTYLFIWLLIYHVY